MTSVAPTMSAWGKTLAAGGPIDTAVAAAPAISLVDVMNETKINAEEQASLALVQRLQVCVCVPWVCAVLPSRQL